MKRRSIYIDEFSHRSPIPNASRIGNILVSGLIRGVDPATQALAATLEQQCALMFDHMRLTAEQGGATVEDIVKVTPDHGSADGGGRAGAMRFHGCD